MTNWNRLGGGLLLLCRRLLWISIRLRSGPCALVCVCAWQQPGQLTPLMRFPSAQEVDRCHFLCRTQNAVASLTHMHTRIHSLKLDGLIFAELIYILNLHLLCLCIHLMCKCNMTFPDFQDTRTIGVKFRLMLEPLTVWPLPLSPLSLSAHRLTVRVWEEIQYRLNLFRFMFRLHVISQISMSSSTCAEPGLNDVKIYRALTSGQEQLQYRLSGRRTDRRGAQAVWVTVVSFYN